MLLLKGQTEIPFLLLYNTSTFEKCDQPTYTHHQNVTFQKKGSITWDIPAILKYDKARKKFKFGIVVLIPRQRQ